jgi:hypothetical protein
MYRCCGREYSPFPGPSGEKRPYAVPVAKKAKTPRPPSVQAPKRRDSKPTRPSGLAGLRPYWPWIAAGAAAIAVVVIVVVVTSGSGSPVINDAGVKQAMVAAGCTYRDVKPLPPKKNPTNYHSDVPTLTTPTKGLWSTSPPSGGGHYGAWAVWGFYRQTVNVRQVVHNEEHGGVIIWWGPKVPGTTIDKLESFYAEKSDGMFGTPYPALGDKIALTAWTGDPAKYYRNGNYGLGHIAICNDFNQKAFATFRDAFRGKGPEGIPLSSDTPGSGPG